jgi:malonyl-CoA/methylmalonyl-CoA synthetase
VFPCLETPSDRVALRVGERTLTQRELAAACAAHVVRLAATGVPAGARVGVWTQPALETLVAFVAHAAAGYVSVPLDPKLGERELAHVVADAAPRACVAADPSVRAGTQPIVVEPDGDARLVARPVRGEPALVLYTSGTTGAPKGAVLTDANIASNLDALARAWAWTDADTVVHALPMFHVHGLVLGLFGSVRRGGALTWVPKFSPDAVAAALAPLGRSGVLFAVPTMYHRLCEASPEVHAALRGARLLVSGSAPLSAREHRRVEALTGQRPIERYGLTETLIDCSTRHDGDRRAGVVGPPLDGVELRLADDGEIWVRGPNVCAGYLNRTEPLVDADGWFHTGDVGELSDDGYVRIVGRRSTDIIKCGGFKVGAGEVEAALLEFPGIAEAAVIGAPDADLGERIVAFVVVTAAIDAAAAIDHVAAQLSPHKRPREVRVVDALPRNAMGKIQKTRLRDP